MLKRYFPALSAVCVLTALPALAQDHASHHAQAKLMKGASVGIEGCVTRGQEKDSYVLGSVKEIPGQPLETGKRRVYWLDSRKHVRDHVGHVVLLSGRIDKIQEDEIEVKKTDEGMKVEIEGPGTQVTTTPAIAGVTGTSGQTAKEVDIRTTSIRLKVDKVEVKGSC